MTAKRRLPVLQTAPTDDVPPRPPWQWALFTAGLLVLQWLVLALLTSPLANAILRWNVGPWISAEDLASRLDSTDPAVLSHVALENGALQAVVVGVASFGAGFVTGTWGPRRGSLEAAAGGTLVSVLALGLAVTKGDALGSSWLLARVGLVLVPLAAAGAAFGAKIGSRKKRVLDGP